MLGQELESGQERVIFKNKVELLRSYLGSKIDIVVGTKIGLYKGDKCLVEPDRTIFCGSSRQKILDILIVNKSTVALFYDRPSPAEIEPIAY